MTPEEIVLDMSFLKGLKVTGKDVPPAIEGCAYATEHLVFLGEHTATLTGRVEVILNSEQGIAVPFSPAFPEVPAVELEVTSEQFVTIANPSGFGTVCLHRIQVVTNTPKSRQQSKSKRPPS